ncbi:MAG: hypothetical protein ACE5Q6_12655 [Dehalococcoidia bacterium]
MAPLEIMDGGAQDISYKSTIWVKLAGVIQPEAVVRRSIGRVTACTEFDQQPVARLQLPVKMRETWVVSQTWM